jgi:uroporphyrinogen decarboxylase
MSSRKVVLDAISHKEPERVPVDMGATPSSGISAIAYNKLKRHLGFNHPTRVYDVVQQLAQIDEEMAERLGIDCLDIGRTFNDKESDWYKTQLSDGSEAFYPVWFKPVKEADGSFNAYDRDGDLLAKMPAGGTFFDQSRFPYLDGYPDDFDNIAEAMDKVLWSAFVHSPWDNAAREDFWQQLRSRALRLRSGTDAALVVVCGCNLFEWGTFLRRMDNFLLDLALDPANVERLLDKLLEIHLATLEKVCQSVGDIVDVIRFGDDLGTERAPFMAPQTYRKLFKPRHKILCDYVKANSGMHTFLHSCGSIYKLLPDIIEAGIEIINPVQTVCTDMEPVRLKREFGGDITFWGGGCDTRTVLNSCSPQEVKKHVLANLEIFSKDGGYVFNTVHNILPEVNPENIIAMFDAINEFNGKK